MLSMTNLKNHRWKCVLVDLVPSSHIYCLLPSTPIFKNTTVIPGLRLQYTVGLWIKAWVHTHGASCNSIQLYLKGLFGTVWRHWQSDHKALHTIAHYSMTHIQLFHLANTHSPYHCVTAHYKQSAMNISCIPVMSVTSETRQDPCTHHKCLL